MTDERLIRIALFSLVWIIGYVVGRLHRRREIYWLQANLATHYSMCLDGREQPPAPNL